MELSPKVAAFFRKWNVASEQKALKVAQLPLVSYWKTMGPVAASILFNPSQNCQLSSRDEALVVACNGSTPNRHGNTFRIANRPADYTRSK